MWQVMQRKLFSTGDGASESAPTGDSFNTLILDFFSWKQTATATIYFLKFFNMQMRLRNFMRKY